MVGLAACGPSKAELKEEADVFYGLGVVHLNEGNIPEALKELTTAVEMYPGDETFHNALGLAYFAKKMHDDALRHFKKAVEIKSDFSDARTNLSAVYLEDGRWDEAISEAGKALENIFYNNPELAYLNRGRGYYEKAEYEEAAADFQRAVKARPTYALAYYNLGMAYKRTEQYRKAKNAFSLLLRYSPNHVEGRYNLALIHLELQELDQAKSAFSDVIKKDPGGDLAQSSRSYLDLLK